MSGTGEGEPWLRRVRLRTQLRAVMAAEEARERAMSEDVEVGKGAQPFWPVKPDRLLQFFRYDHLPKPLADASRPFCELAEKVVLSFPPNAERTVCLRKLLEAKDCGIRSLLERDDVEGP